jgi:hypothetical protein
MDMAKQLCKKQNFSNRSKITIELIGSWTLKVANQKVSFNALTIKDLVTNLVKLVQFDNSTSAHVAMKIINTWLARYPKPVSCVFDQGLEFHGCFFYNMFDRYDIECWSTTTQPGKLIPRAVGPYCINAGA